MDVSDGGDQLTTYLANLSALYRRDAGLAAELDALPFAQAPQLEPARDGNPTVRLTADDGKTIYAHSRYRPRDEARKFVDGQPEVENPTFVLAGLGLGHHLPEFQRRYDRPLLVVCEPDLPLIKAALCIHNVADLLGEGRLLFLTADDKSQLHEKLHTCNADLMLGMHFVALPHTQRVAAEFHQRMRGLLTDFIAYNRLQVITLLKIARTTCTNVALNLPSYLANPGIETLAGRAAGFPAIIVAAGPSLARNVAALDALRERAVVIAVQTVFKLLLALGRGPHFVTSLDYHEVSAEFFRGVDEVGDCILVAEPKATHRVLDMYPGRMRVLRHEFVDALLRTAAPQRGRLKPGSTVAHLAFYLAQHLGCDPIILVGQDLCYSEGFYYPPGMPIERIWQPEFGRFQTLEMKQWERIVRNRPILRVVKDIHGRDAYSDDQLFSYAEQFQSDFLSAPQRVIHATEGGMRLQGVEIMSLHEAAERFCTRPLPKDLFAEPGAAVAGPGPGRAAAEIEQRLEELREVGEIAAEMSALLEKLDGLLERPTEFNRLVARVDELRTRMHTHDRTYRMITSVSQMAELRRYTADRRIGDPQRETAETARRRLQRDREFVAAFSEGCEYLERMLPRALDRIREQAS